MFSDATIDTPNKLSIWESRARDYGRRSVVDLGIPDTEFDQWTQLQSDLLFSCLKPLLRGSESLALDYGAGVGRFSARLSTDSGTQVVAYEPCRGLSELIPHTPGVTVYEPVPPSAFFQAEARKFDIIWITLVLGGLPDHVLPELSHNLLDCLAPGGVIFFAEHTSNLNVGSSFWRFRPLDYYLHLFQGLMTRKIGSYITRGTEVSIMAGISP